MLALLTDATSKVQPIILQLTLKQVVKIPLLVISIPSSITLRVALKKNLKNVTNVTLGRRDPPPPLRL